MSDATCPTRTLLLWGVGFIILANGQPTCCSIAQAIPGGSTETQAYQDLRKAASWDWPEVAIFEQHLLSYMDQRELDEAGRAEVQSFWQSTAEQTTGDSFLNRLIESAALIEPRIAKVYGSLSDVSSPVLEPGELPWLTSDVPGWMQDTLRLAIGRAFAQRRMYDEALETLAGLEVGQVCDPASLIFYRAVSEHHLLKKDSCLAHLEQLLEREEELPTRYALLAKLMLSDIQPLESDSLDEVSRMMRDVERRLDLGRAGTRVRDQEEEIVSKLDKMIEKIEEQMQQQQSQSQQNGSAQQSQSQGMQDSQIAGGSGPGDVDQKDNGNRSGWGNLPPAQRQQALQRLTEELPSHYRDVIEGYFRQLAKENR
ncbi:hypothetical protein [Aureliella helgolandensis]|uniref:Anaphase-promoting complex, cyclosome, subunit 3 n=1 Tax=Aureliella helgolandensis TaxID=2527968 RepID=A0A518G6G2_9BACT|nr:hypothetical protein [Aureliella helgolandensis]QDV24154.1 hypothetical protein Q31a_24670 [Aureliella helgolandensis]